MNNKMQRELIAKKRKEKRKLEKNSSMEHSKLEKNVIVYTIAIKVSDKKYEQCNKRKMNTKQKNSSVRQQGYRTEKQIYK